MKHIIFSIAFLFSSITLAAEPKPDLQNEILERVDSTGQWISSTLDKLADKLGVTVSYLWPAYVRRVQVSGASTLFLGLFFISFGIILFNLLQKHSKKETASEDGAEACVVFSWLSLVIFTVAGFLVTICNDSISNLIAPEPEALRLLVDSVKDLRR